jgi:3-hydroxybutyryl-CoA dehydrogenase
LATQISTIAVVGSGNMGRGIAEVAAGAGIQTTLLKVTPGDLEKPLAQITKSLDRRVKKGKLTQEQRDATLANLTVSADFAAVASAEVVIESVIEDTDTKRDVFKKLEAEMHPEAVLGSNTSSLRLDALAEGLERPERFLGVHFFGPVPAMELVELALTGSTADFASDRAEALCRQMAKTPVRVQATSGYVVNRLLVPYLLHGIATLEAGTADAEGIDTAMRLGCGHPMGPLALCDLIGLDIVLAMAETMGSELGDARYEVPATLRKLCDAGQLGRKSGVGIYDYSGEAPVLNAALQR